MCYIDLDRKGHMYALYSRLYLIKLKSSNNWNNLSVNNIHFNSNTPSVWPCHIVLSAIQPHLNLYWARKRKAYSIDHGFIFKVNKKTYYVKSKKKRIFTSSHYHTSFETEHTSDSRKSFGMLEWYHKMTIPWFIQMLISSVSSADCTRVS